MMRHKTFIITFLFLLFVVKFVSAQNNPKPKPQPKPKPADGIILGKALQSLDAGMGTIKVVPAQPRKL